MLVKQNGARKQSETFEDFYDQLENDQKSPPTNSRTVQNMELIDLVESSDQPHPSIAGIRVEVAGDGAESNHSEESFKLSVDR